MNEPLNLVVADPDTAYLQRLAAYVRQSKWAERLSVQWCSKQDTLMQAVRSSGGPNPLMVVHRDWLPEERDHHWVVLDEFHTDDTPVALNAPSHEEPLSRLFKYQPIEHLLASVVNIAERSRYRANDRSTFSASSLSVVSVLSAAGGTGKTTAAYQLVRLLGAQGRRSLLINLEPICSIMAPDPDYSQLFGQYLYFSRGGSPKAVEWAKKLIRRHPRGPIDVLGGSGAFREMEELSVDDIRRLVEHIRALGVYRAVIVDVESGVSPIVKGAMASSDRLVCMLTEESASIRKTAQFLNACPKWLEMDSELIRSRLCLAFNRWNGEAGVDFRALGVPVAAKLPYVAQWKRNAAWEEEQLDPLFERQLLQLMEALQLDARGAGHASTA